MICPNCGARMVGITYPDGYMECECENCGITIQDAQMNEEYNERYKDGRFHY